MYPHERSLVKRLADKPFALIGVNSDTDLDRLKARMKEEQISWRSFWCGKDGTRGAIPKAWNVSGWPTIYVLDHEMKIRAKGVRGEAMDKVVDQLLVEMGAMAPETGEGEKKAEEELPPPNAE